MSAKPLKLFIVKDKKNPHAVPRLIKALGKTQVSKFLANSTSIEAGAPLDIAELMADHQITVEDASAFDESSSSEGESNSSIPAASASPTNGETPNGDAEPQASSNLTEQPSAEEKTNQDPIAD